MHGLPSAGAGMAGDEGILHGLPQRHEEGSAQPGAGLVSAAHVHAAAAATSEPTMNLYSIQCTVQQVMNAGPRG